MAWLISDDDVEEMAPERPRTMDDLEQNSREQSSGASGQTQRGERSAENTRQPGRFRQGHLKVPLYMVHLLHHQMVNLLSLVVHFAFVVP